MSGVSHASLIGGYVTAGGATAYRYFRLVVSSSTFAARVLELRISDDSGTTFYPQSIGNMTSNSAPSPLVASASSEKRDAYQAFNSNTNNLNRWEPDTNSNEWLQIDLGSGNEIVANWMQILSTGSTYTVDTGEIQGSNTGSFSGEEETLVSWSGNSDTSQIETF